MHANAITIFSLLSSNIKELDHFYLHFGVFFNPNKVS